MTVIEYRRKNKRCRTCMYAKQNEYSSSFGGLTWFCKAKEQLYDGRVATMRLKGCFCELYSPKEDVV